MRTAKDLMAEIEQMGAGGACWYDPKNIIDSEISKNLIGWNPSIEIKDILPCIKKAFLIYSLRSRGDNHQRLIQQRKEKGIRLNQYKISKNHLPEVRNNIRDAILVYNLQTAHPMAKMKLREMCKSLARKLSGRELSDEIISSIAGEIIKQIDLALPVEPILPGLIDVRIKRALGLDTHEIENRFATYKEKIEKILNDIKSWNELSIALRFYGNSLYETYETLQFDQKVILARMYKKEEGVLARIPTHLVAAEFGEKKVNIDNRLDTARDNLIQEFSRILYHQLSRKEIQRREEFRIMARRFPEFFERDTGEIYLVKEIKKLAVILNGFFMDPRRELVPANLRELCKHLDPIRKII